MRNSFMVLALALAAVPRIAVADIEDIDYVLGRWHAQTDFYQDDIWQSTGTTRALGDTKLGGAYYVLNTTVLFPGDAYAFEVIISEDRFNGGFRAAFFDDRNGYMDVYYGDIQDGVLVMDNLSTGTAFPDGAGGKVYGRVDLSQNERGFVLVAYIADTPDGEWAPYMRVTFEPAD